MSYHHRWLLHGSHQNTSTAPRMSMAIHLRTDKSTPKSPRHALTVDLENETASPVIFRR